MRIANNYYSKEKVLFFLIGLHYRVNRGNGFIFGEQINQTNVWFTFNCAVTYAKNTLSLHCTY